MFQNFPTGRRLRPRGLLLRADLRGDGGAALAVLGAHAGRRPRPRQRSGQHRLSSFLSCYIIVVECYNRLVKAVSCSEFRLYSPEKYERLVRFPLLSSKALFRQSFLKSVF